jgi:hypothetical protein
LGGLRTSASSIPGDWDGAQQSDAGRGTGES